MPDLQAFSMKTTRFATVVDEAGKPEPYTLWVSPEKDPEFRKALHDERVMTILREPATNKADVASVGYVEKPNALYLIFPRPLTGFKEMRIVGIKDDMFAPPKPRGKVVKPSEPKKQVIEAPRVARFIPLAPPPPVIETKPPPKARAEASTPPVEPPRPEPEPLPPEPKPLPKFRVSAVITSTVERTVEVTAKNQREAREAAAALVNDEPVDFSAGTRQVKIAKAVKT